MAKLYGLQSEIVRFLKSMDDEHFGDPPQFDVELEFDAETNQSVINGLDNDWNSHTLEIDGILRRNGQPVTINVPSQHFIDRGLINQYWTDLNNEIDWLDIQILAWPEFTTAQKQTWLVNNFDRTLKEIRFILRFIRWSAKLLKIIF